MMKAGGDLGVSFLNLQIIQQNSKPLTRPRDKSEVALWKEAPNCM